MRIHIPDGAVLFVALCALILALPNICFGTPFLWVADNGDDNSQNPFSPTTPFATYDRAIAYMIEVGSETIGVKFMPGNRSPSMRQAMQILHGKPDVVRVVAEPVEIIPGHGKMPSSEYVASTEAGIKMTTTSVWSIGSYNGQLFEFQSDIVITTGSY